MKYKILGLLLCLCTIAIAVAATIIKTDGEHRYHQHLEEAAYTPCGNHGEDIFCSHLPLILIETGGAQIVKEAATQCTVKIIDSDGNNHLTDEAELETSSQIKVRGKTSAHFEKKSLLVRLTQEDGKTYRKEEMLGMAAHDEWALHGPVLDKTLIRNYMCYNIAGEIMEWAPNVRFCEVFIDGSYNGIYVLTETITNGDDCRLNFTDSGKNSPYTGYVTRLDRGSENQYKNISTFTQYTKKTGSIMNIVYPGNKKLTGEKKDTIEQEISDFEKAIYSYDYDSKKYGYKKYIDEYSFADYFIINEFSGNYDAGIYSTYLYKDLRGKYRMCVWDFNNAFDNYIEYKTSTSGFQMQNAVWFEQLLKDEDFCNLVIKRYGELRKSYLSDEYLNEYIDETIEWLGPAVDRNFQVWGFERKDRVYPENRNPHSHEEAVSQLKAFCNERGEWMDENISTIRQYSAESKVKSFNHEIY